MKTNEIMRKIFEYLTILIAIPFAVLSFYSGIMISLIMWDSRFFYDPFDDLFKQTK